MLLSKATFDKCIWRNCVTFSSDVFAILIKSELCTSVVPFTCLIPAADSHVFSSVPLGSDADENRERIQWTNQSRGNREMILMSIFLSHTGWPVGQISQKAVQSPCSISLRSGSEQADLGLDFELHDFS